MGGENMPKKAKKQNKPTAKFDWRIEYSLAAAWSEAWPSLRALIVTVIPLLAICLTVFIFLLSDLVSSSLAFLALVYLPFTPIIYFVAYLFFLYSHRHRPYFLARMAAAALTLTLYVFISGFMLLGSMFCTDASCGGYVLLLFLPPAAFIGYYPVLFITLATEKLSRYLNKEQKYAKR